MGPLFPVALLPPNLTLATPRVCSQTIAMEIVLLEILQAVRALARCALLLAIASELAHRGSKAYPLDGSLCNCLANRAPDYFAPRDKGFSTRRKTTPEITAVPANITSESSQ